MATTKKKAVRPKAKKSASSRTTTKASRTRASPKKKASTKRRARDATGNSRTSNGKFVKGGSGGPGRKAGVPNKATRLIKELAAKEVEDRDLVRKLGAASEAELLSLAGIGNPRKRRRTIGLRATEALLGYAFGRPKVHVDATVTGPRDIISDTLADENLSLADELADLDDDEEL